MQSNTNGFTPQTELHNEAADELWIACNPHRNHHIRKMREGEFAFGTHVLIRRERGGLRKVPVYAAEGGVIQ